jgi:hypothetical protein
MNEPLSLHETENNTVVLHYGSKGGVTVTGGDGNYSFTCESPLLKAEMAQRNYISFEPAGVGYAAVTIRDSSGESYVLNVIIIYTTDNIPVSRIEATVVGDALTAAEQEELKAKALATVPVKAGGGYKLVYIRGDRPEGAVIIYPEKYGEEGLEGIFTQKAAGGDDGFETTSYTFRYNDTVRTFTIKAADQETRTSVKPYPPVYTQLFEDLTEQYRADYPGVEQVYTSQIIGAGAE